VEEAAMPISPVEALKRLNEPVTVEMFIKRTKSCTCSSQFFLDCEENKRDPKNLGLVVTPAGAARFKEAGMDDLAELFQGKTIRVQGVVILKDGLPYIEVDDPGQIEVVG
jgi:predicted RecB family nuclease